MSAHLVSMPAPQPTARMVESPAAAGQPGEDPLGERLVQAGQEFSRRERPEPADTARFKEFFYQTVGRCSMGQKRRLAMLLAHNAWLPRTVLLYLALEEHDVAAPVLMFSPALNEMDMIGLAPRLSAESLRVLCRRPDLSLRTIHALLDAGGTVAAQVLMRNQALARAAEPRPAAEAALAGRPDTRPVLRQRRSEPAAAEPSVQAHEVAVPLSAPPVEGVAEQVEAPRKAPAAPALVTAPPPAEAPAQPPEAKAAAAVAPTAIAPVAPPALAPDRIAAATVTAPPAAANAASMLVKPVVAASPSASTGSTRGETSVERSGEKSGEKSGEAARAELVALAARGGRLGRQAPAARPLLRAHSGGLADELLAIGRNRDQGGLAAVVERECGLAPTTTALLIERGGARSLAVMFTALGLSRLFALQLIMLLDRKTGSSLANYLAVRDELDRCDATACRAFLSEFGARFAEGTPGPAPLTAPVRRRPAGAERGGDRLPESRPAAPRQAMGG